MTERQIARPKPLSARVTSADFGRKRLRLGRGHPGLAGIVSGLCLLRHGQWLTSHNRLICGGWAGIKEGREDRSKQPEQEAERGYGAEAEREIPEDESFVVLQDLPE